MKLASRKLKDNPNQSSLRYLKRELDRDIGEKEKQQLIPEMINTADLVVVIAEKERWPSYLHECNKLLFWDIQDPVGMADESADEVYREVRRRVEELVAEIG
jgi:protein-tyrosine-phosphatase